MPEKNNGSHYQPTREEFNRRIVLTRKLLATGTTPKEIVGLYMQAYSIGQRTVYKYISLAREDMVVESGKPRHEHIADAYTFYTELKRKSKDDNVRFKAQKEICRLLGLNAPVRISGADGQGPVQVQHAHLVVSVDDLKMPLEERKKLLQAIRDRGDSSRDENGNLISGGAPANPPMPQQPASAFDLSLVPAPGPKSNLNPSQQPEVIDAEFRRMLDEDQEDED